MSDAVALPDTNRERDAGPNTAPNAAPSAAADGAPHDDGARSPLSGQALQAELMRAQAAANSAPESEAANAAEGVSEAPSRRRSTRRSAPEAAESEEAAPRRRARKITGPAVEEAASPAAEAEAPIMRRRGRPPKNAGAPASEAPEAPEATSASAATPSALASPAPGPSSPEAAPQVLASGQDTAHIEATEREAAASRERTSDRSDPSSDSGSEERQSEARERNPEPRTENQGAEDRPGERGFEPRGPEGRGQDRGVDGRGLRFRGRPEGRPEGRPDAREEGRREGFAPNGFGARPSFPSERTGWREEFGPNGIRLTNREIERRDSEARANEGRANEGRAPENRAPEGHPNEARPLEGRGVEARGAEGRPIEGRPAEGRPAEGREREARGFEARALPSPQVIPQGRAAEARGFEREEGRGRPERGDGRDNRGENRFGRERNDRPERNGRGDNRDGGRDSGRDNRGRDAGQRDNGQRDGGQNSPGERGLDRLERDALRAKPELDSPALEALPLEELRRIVLEMGEENAASLGRDELSQRALELQALAQGVVFKRGLLEILGDGRGFLRCEGYRSADGDVYVASAQIKRFNLRTGDMVSGQVRPPKGDERHSGLLRVESINGMAPELLKARKEFEKLTPVFPDERFRLETSQENITARIIDLVSPIGKGQRGLIVAPPKAGKTTLIKSIANSISRNHPEAELIVLLIDERPEEVTDISRSVRGEVVASTFDETAENHMRVAEMVFEKAKRMVEQKKDVVVLLDSLTRLSRAANLTVSPSGRTMSGGLDPAAMHKPKKMFGAARNIEEGGSLTILATVLVDTGSRMDEYIFEEFKGTGNMDLVLDRNLFDQRIFPAIDINRSGTRRDDLLMSKEELASTFHLRRTLAQLDNDKSVTLLIDRLRNTKTNADFMQIVSRSVKQAPVQTP